MPSRLLALLFLLAFCAAPAGAQSTPNAASHTHAQDSARIRDQHLKRLDARLEQAPQLLRQQCRYESDIPTPPPKGWVALSFDDGPEPGQTEYILEVLEKAQVPASFFLIGEKVAKHPELVAKIAARGVHVIGNHSWSHPNFHDIGVEAQAREVVRTLNVLEPYVQGMRFFRYPYGNATCETNDYVHQQGQAIVGWHIDSCDWAFDKNGSVDPKEALSCGVLRQNRSNFVEHVTSSIRAHNGGIVLMHEIHPNTVHALGEVIEQAKAMGYRFTTVTDPLFKPSLR